MRETEDGEIINHTEHTHTNTQRQYNDSIKLVEERKHRSPPHSDVRSSSASKERYNDRHYRHRTDSSDRHKRHRTNYSRSRDYSTDNIRSKRSSTSHSTTAMTSTTLLQSNRYIPPYKMRELLKTTDITDHNTEQYQRLQFDALRKSINGIINKVNHDNIQYVVTEIFEINIVRGRGILCQSIYNAQSISTVFTDVYACLIAVINTKMPEIGELMCKRVIAAYQRAYKQKHKSLLLSTTLFIAHLTNQYVLHELVALQVLTQLLDGVSNDMYIEAAIEIMKHVGARLTEITAAGMNHIFDTLRGMLHSGTVDERIQYLIEKLFDIRRDAFKQYPAISEQLDLVESNDQITHELTLDEKYDIEKSLDTYAYDAEYDLHEQQYAEIKRDIVGDDEELEHDDGTATQHTGTELTVADGATELQPYHIDDHTSVDQVSLRRTIYLTIMSSLNYEECVHKLLKHIKPTQEKILCEMILECCSVERTYLKFYGLVAERLCQLQRVYCETFDELFATYYSTAHRYETKKLRNVAKLYAHLLYSDVIEWSVLEYIQLTEDDTTSAGRIFIKILFRELSEQMGLVKLKENLDSPTISKYTTAIFNTDSPRNTRFSINYFTSIGLGLLTETLRAHLAAQPKIDLAQQIAAVKAEYSNNSSSSSSDSSTDSSSSSSSSSSSDSSSDTDSSSDSGADRRKRRRRSRTHCSSRTSHKRSTADVRVKEENAT